MLFAHLKKSMKCETEQLITQVQYVFLDVIRRMIRTFSEAVASLVPSLLKAIAASGLLWPGIIVTARCNTGRQTKQ